MDSGEPADPVAAFDSAHPLRRPANESISQAETPQRELIPAWELLKLPETPAARQAETGPSAASAGRISADPDQPPPTSPGDEAATVQSAQTDTARVQATQSKPSNHGRFELDVVHAPVRTSEGSSQGSPGEAAVRGEHQSQTTQTGVAATESAALARPDGRTTVTVDAAMLATVAIALLALVGSLSPWITAITAFGSVSVNGTEGDGKYTLAAALVLAATTLVRERRWYPWLFGIASAAIVAITGYDLIHVNNKINSFNASPHNKLAHIEIGGGLWLLVAASVAVVLLGVAQLLTRRGPNSQNTRKR